MSAQESKGNDLPGKDQAAEEPSNEGSSAAAGLADSVITRAQAVKLAGLGGAGFMLTLLLPDGADARRRRKKKRRRRRRKAQVTPNPLIIVPGVPTVLTVTNPSDEPLTISGVKVLDEDGSVIRTIDLPDATVAPGDTGIVTITDPLVDAEGLRLIDGRGVPITVVDENGVTVGVGDIDVA